jgi:hypothetical protein
MSAMRAPGRVAVPFDRLAGVAALLTAASGLAYAVAFVLLANILAASVFLLLGGVLATPVLVALRRRIRAAEPELADWGVLLAITGALGSAVHGGFDLANAIHPPPIALAELPNAVDPRGLLTFGVAGVGLLVVGWAIVRTGAFPRALGYLACLVGVLLVVLYLGRLIVLDPTNPLILVTAALTGFLLNPALYVWLGVTLLRR